MPIMKTWSVNCDTTGCSGGEGNGTPLQYSCLENLVDGGRRGEGGLVGCSPRGREESDTTERLHFPFSLTCIGEGNGNPLQWSRLENPRDGVPGRLPSMGSHRVGHDWSDLAAAAAGCSGFASTLGKQMASETSLYHVKWAQSAICWMPGLQGTCQSRNRKGFN